MAHLQGKVIAITGADDALRAQIQQGKRTLAIDPDAIARGIAYAIEQPDEVDVGEIVIRPTAQS